MIYFGMKQVFISIAGLVLSIGILADLVIVANVVCRGSAPLWIITAALVVGGGWIVRWWAFWVR